MGRPVGVREIHQRRRMAIRASRDGQAYYLPDSGCKMATAYLNHQSLCLECPFETCKMDSNLGRSNAK